MDDSNEHGHQMRALAMRVAALEDNVAFLEHWCEEQQDLLDRTVGLVAYDHESDDEGAGVPRAVLRVVDLRDVRVDGAGMNDEAAAGDDAIVSLVDTDHDWRVRQIRSQLDRLRTRLAASLAPLPELPAEHRPVPAPPPPRPRPGSRISAKPAGRTAP